jgi:predicted TPR repeat methyltransferase
VLLTREERITALGYDYRSQEKEVVEECDLCGSRALTIVAHADRYGFPAETRACARCGLVFLSPRMTADAYRDFYRDTYRPLVSAYHGRLIDAATVEEEQEEYAERLVKFLEPIVNDRHPRNLLDIGGSTGVIAAALAQTFGVAATVLDPAPAELERARNRGLTVEIGTLEAFNLEGTHYDLITLCQTIDHLLGVRSSLLKIREALAPEGLFFVDIVDFRAAYLRQGSVDGAVKIDHPHYLTESTTETYLARVGLRWLRKDYAPDHLHVGYVCEIGEPTPNAVPDHAEVEHLFWELRQVQNAPERQ